MDGESSGVGMMPAPEEPPYFPEQWPRKVCAFCNLGERSQLGQGELVRLSCPEDFTPENAVNHVETTDLMDVSSTGDKSPRGLMGGGAVTCRRQKSLAKCRNPSLTNFTEPVEELSIVGYSDKPELTALFESTGYYYVHTFCAMWSIQNRELITERISPILVQSSLRRCAYCAHYGASIPCRVQTCNRTFHLPCAAASGCFQDMKIFKLFCNQHLGQVSILLENSDAICVSCYKMDDIASLVMCSVCGSHYHGHCLGISINPSVRAGWQCTVCRVCQVCRQSETEISKFMGCEHCHKAYHPGCLRPVVTSVPRCGWKCKCCRVCTDCGSRTPGAGLSSRWHSHYTVCDSCYQQRNKGYSCPLCNKAYRAAGYREMVQCTVCKRFVHSGCDGEADPVTYQHRKDTKPDYEYVCLACKGMAIVKRKDYDEFYTGDSSLTASQESLYGDGDSSEFDYQGGDEAHFSIGLGKGKPFCASKVAKKRLSLQGVIGRPKGVGKFGYQKRQKMNEFGRKRGPKAKMRGIFGAPGVGLQRPISDSFNKEEEPGVENRLVLCSAKDKFVLTQDICVMCGAIGTDTEGCLIACAQCGQCYHPYCVNVKVTKVILQRGWRCLDCTVCEKCGLRDREDKLILCDDCDISYHTDCLDPPMENVPYGTWKCKSCAVCQICGSGDPGFNSIWQKNFTQCGPCASHSSCASCQETYTEGDLIIQCVVCSRWLHCSCDHIMTEADAEKCAQAGYHCIICRPRDEPPPHQLCNQPKLQPNKYHPRLSPPIVRSPEHYKSPMCHLIDGVYLSEIGMHHIKSLTIEHQQTRKKRRKVLPVLDKDADIMATIDSVVAGNSLDNSLEDNRDSKMEMIDIKEEPGEILKDGMPWTLRDQPPPEGYTVCTSENGVPILKRKRQRNLQKLGIGGFVPRNRGTRKDKDEECETDKQLAGDNKQSSSINGVGVGVGVGVNIGVSSGSIDGKPRKKTLRKKPKTKLSESFPPYLQEAFFGKNLMDLTKDKDLKSSSDSDSEKNTSGNTDTIQLSQDEIKAIEQVNNQANKYDNNRTKQNIIKREDDGTSRSIDDDNASDTDALGDILPISSDFVDNELVNTIMNEPDEELVKASVALNELEDPPGPSEFNDILGSPHFNLVESMVPDDTNLPNMASKDVEDMLKSVLTDESQESQESSVFPLQNQTAHTPSTPTPLVSLSPHPGMQTGLPLARPQVPPVSLPTVGQATLNSPLSFPPPSPYHSEYSNSPQFSPAFSEPPSPWVNPEEEGPSCSINTSISNNQRNNSQKLEKDELLGPNATSSAILYANLNHPDWKIEFPVWNERLKQILKKWRSLPNETRQPYLSQARDNRATNRMRKTQQVSQFIPSTIPVTATSSPTNTNTTKPVTTTMAAGQVSPVVPMGTGQNQIGLLSSVINHDNSQQDKPSTSSSVTSTAVGVGHLAEVCAVQGQGPMSRQLTSTSPSPSPTSTSSSSSPRPSSVNSINNYISNLSHQESNNSSAKCLPQSPATTATICTTPAVSFCNTIITEGQLSSANLHQQQLRPVNITNSNNITTIVNSPSVVVSQSPSGTAGAIVVAGTVRQLSSVDHQIRVLTPSEIMRTLPSLSQEHYDPPPTAIIHTVPVQTPVMEQDRLANRDRTTKEAEQERAWKQLQQYRQQQHQLQQQVIQDQRLTAMARVQRQISDDGVQLNTDNNTGLTTQLQVSTAQDGNHLGPMASPSPGSRATFATPPMKVIRGNAPQSPHQVMPRLPNQQCISSARPVSVAVRPGLVTNFPQPPSPFSPQAPQSPHDYPQSPASSHVTVSAGGPEHFQRFENPAEAFTSAGNQTPRPLMPGTPTYATSPRNDVFSQSPGTPRALFNPPTPRSSTHVYAPSRTPDPYSNQPPTPSPAPSYPSPRPELRQQEVVLPTSEVFNQQSEVNQQLRDLLQRSQFRKKTDGMPGNTWTPDTNPTAADQQFEPTHVQIPQHAQPANNVEGTFRHPLPPGIRPRMPIQLNVFIRNTPDARLQSIDPRTRMLLQRPQVPGGIPQQHFQAPPQQQQQQVLQQRMTAPRNPQEQYDILQQSQPSQQPSPQQQQQQPGQPRFPDPNHVHNQQNMVQRVIRTGQDMSASVRMMNAQTIPRPGLMQTTVNDNTGTSSEASEIPDNVTAELEKLEQEGAPMVEVEGVGAILGDLADDDDELLAEMGADFNILEYADPELGNITGGEKTNILDMDLEQVEVETKEEKQKKEKEEEQKSEVLAVNATAHSDIANESSNSGVSTPVEPTMVPNVAPAATAATMPISAASQPQGSIIQQQQQQSGTIIAPNHAQAMAVQQQMHQQVQQAAAMGRPMPPGTRLLSAEGVIGVVTSSNTVTISYPSTFPGHPQRILQSHMQPTQPQRLGMRVAGVQGIPGRVVSVGHMIGPRMPLAPPPPPPPPYPGPPPPYPGPVQMGLCPGGRGVMPPRAPVHIGHQVPGVVPGPPMAPIVHTGATPPSITPHPHRRPLLLQEQPLLLEDLLEQEKREQEKQQQQQQQQQQQAQQQVDSTPTTGALLSDSEFERLRADVLASSALGSPPQGIVVSGSATSGPIIRPPGKPRPPSTPGTPWPQATDSGKIIQPRQPIATQTPPEARVATFNIPQLPAPPAPPEVISSEQDRQVQLQYELWLHNQQQILLQQQKYYETEVQKLRKSRKALNSRQRQLRKSGNELTEIDAAELQRISSEQSILQKQLDASRKQVRQHGMLAQEYKSKQQQRQTQPQTSEPYLNQNQNRGGGNPHHPLTPIPIKSIFGRYGYFKPGLRGGSPMWSTKPECSKGKTVEPRITAATSNLNEDKPNTSSVVHRKTGISQSKINSLVHADYNDFDDDSHTPPQTPPTTETKTNTTSSLAVEKSVSSSLAIGSPDKLETMPDTTDYDDDKTIVNEEVTLSSTAQRDSDDTVIEELVDVSLGPVDPDEMQESFFLFEPVDLSNDSNDILSHALVNNTNQNHELVQILQIDPSQNDDSILSDDELVPSNRNKKTLRLDIMRTLQTGKRLVTVTDTPESPDQEDMAVDPSPVTSPFIDNPDDIMTLGEISASEVVIIDPTIKSPEDHLNKECEEEAEKIDSTFEVLQQPEQPNKSETNSDNLNEKKSFDLTEKMSSVSVSNSVSDPINDKDQVDAGEKTKIENSSASDVILESNTVCKTTETISKLVTTTITTMTTSITTIAATSTTNSVTTVASTKQVINLSDNQNQVLPSVISNVADIKVTSESNSQSLEISNSSTSPIITNTLTSCSSGNTNTNTNTNLKTKINSIDTVEPDSVASKILAQLTDNKDRSEICFSVANENVSLFPVSIENEVSSKLTVVPSTAVTLMKTKSSEAPKNNLIKSKVEDKKMVNISEKSKEKNDNLLNSVSNSNSNESLLSYSSSSPVEATTEEKKSDPLNTTDELESMLEAIHNPDENTSDSKKIICDNKPDISSFKRMSPVADEMSLVNILENDSELVINERKENKFQDTDQAKEPSVLHEKISVDKFTDNNEVEESSDVILDMLHNIISSKPEMANTNILEDQRKSTSMIYQMPMPLDTLPYNILQDSLMDFDQPIQDEQEPEEKTKQPPKSLDVPVTKTTPTPLQ
ncbi:GSCOCG00000363001-RA-CDS [Cotesia congregata]|nr:GSCOCG00000363001-RA-CDS [Cotesia congregata]